jgi:hypothetical protein
MCCKCYVGVLQCVAYIQGTVVYGLLKPCGALWGLNYLWQ